MREQFSQAGWTGTDLVIGHSGRAFLSDLLFDTYAISLLFSGVPSMLPNCVKQAFVTKIYVDIIARPVADASGSITELWCFTNWASRINLSGFEESFIDSSLCRIEKPFHKQGITAAPVRYLDR